MTTLVHTLSFSTSAFYTDATGITITNTTTGEVATAISFISLSPSLRPNINATWIVDPVQNDLISGAYDGLGNIRSVDGVDAPAATVEIVNCITPSLIFPLYSSAVVGQGGCIMKDSFTSSANLGGGLLVDTGGIATFDANGFSPNRNSINTSGVKFTATELPNMSDMSSGWTIVCEISKNFFDENYVQALNEIQTVLRVRRSGGDTLIRFIHSNSNPGRVQLLGEATEIAECINNSLSDMVQVHFTGGPGYFKVYLDYMLILDQSNTTSNSIFEIDIMGNGADNVGVSDDSIRNIAFFANNMITKDGNVIGMFGDSQIARGTYLAVSDGNQAILAQTPDGLTGSCELGETIYKNGSITSVIHSRLFKAGIGIDGNRVQHWAQGGSGVTQTSNCTTSLNMGARIDVATGGSYPEPNIVVISIGTNDLSLHAITDFQDGTYAALLQTEINKFTNPSLVVLTTVASRANASPQDSKVDAFNAMVNTQMTGVVVSDIFTALGGHGLDSTGPFPYLEADQLHFNIDGHVIVGETIAATIIANI